MRGAGLEPARYHYHQPLKLACLPFHHPRINRESKSARADEGYLFVEGTAGAAGGNVFGSAFGTSGFAFGSPGAGAGALFACFDITLPELPPKTVPDARSDDIYARYSDVAKNSAASAAVVRDSMLPAPLAPKTVLLEPPNTAPTSAPFPCWRRISITNVTHMIT